jgi:hypothetical protein
MVGNVIQLSMAKDALTASMQWPHSNMAVVAGLAAAALIQTSSVVGAAGTHNLIQLGWAEGESLGVSVHLSSSLRVSRASEV